MKREFEKLKEYVKKEFDTADIKLYNQAYFYRYHILPVFNISLKLAEKYKAEKFVVGVSSLLHDIGLINLPKGKEHNIVGAEKIEGIFKKLSLGFDKEFIEKIKECILCHYGKKEDRKNKEIKVLITADALAHLTTPFLFIRYKISKKSFEDFRKWAIQKIDQDCKRVCFKDEKKEIKIYAKILKKMLFENDC